MQIDDIDNRFIMTLAIDPGGTTGICWRLFNGDVGHGQMTAEFAQEMALSLLYEELPPLTIVMESFILHGSVLKKSRQGVHQAIETIGVYRAVAKAIGSTFVEQTPAQGKRISNDLLKEHGVYVVNLEHARDAARHLALYEMKESLK